MNAPIVRMGTMPVLSGNYVLPWGNAAAILTVGIAPAITYRATARNISRLKAKIRRLKREIKSASRGRKMRLRKRLAKAQRRLERIERVVTRRIEKRKAQGKELTARQKRLRAALRRKLPRNKQTAVQRRLKALAEEAARAAEEAESDDEALAAELDDELVGEPEGADGAEEGPEGQDGGDMAPAEKPFYQRPEVLAAGAVLIVLAAYAMRSK